VRPEGHIKGEMKELWEELLCQDSSDERKVFMGCNVVKEVTADISEE
jgi:hypothetical protein